jgi:hypothetical protein
MPVLDLTHDFAHDIGDDTAWSESYLFGGYDPATDAGLHSRIGFRPNEGTMDVWLDIWLPRARFGHYVAVRDQNTIVDEGIEVEGIRFERLDAMGKWRVVGEAEGDLRTHGAAVEPDAPRLPLSVDATFHALTPPIGADSTARRQREATTVKDSFHAGHFEQAGRWEGTITVGDETYTFEKCRGIRDKSWGPRQWQRLRMWRWFALNFGDDVHLGATRIANPDGDLHRGWLWRDGDFVTIRNLEIETETEADGITPKRSQVIATDKQGGRHEFTGEMIWVSQPDMYGKWEQSSGRTVILMGCGRWEYDGLTGYGFCDYAHHLDAEGRPAVSVE